jgi:hypothetical protein
MNLKRTKVLSIVAIVAMVALFLELSSPVGAQSSNDRPMDPKAAVAEVYSERFAVTVAEAQHRLALQDAFPDLDPEFQKNEAETYGGLWIQHEPEYKIVVAFTRDGDKTVSKHSSYIPANVAPYIEVRTVDKSLQELQDAQQILYESLGQQGIKIDSYVDVKNNLISINVTKAEVGCQ